MLCVIFGATKVSNSRASDHLIYYTIINDCIINLNLFLLQFMVKSRFKHFEKKMEPQSLEIQGLRLFAYVQKCCMCVIYREIFLMRRASSFGR